MPKLYSYNWLLPFFILTGIYAYSQTWQQVNSNTSNEVYDMYFSNENTGFAITANGQVLKTTDAGNNWTVFINETAIKSDASIVCGGNSVICYGKDVDGNNQKVSFSIDSNTTTTAPTVQSVSFPIYHNNQEWNLEGVNAMVNTAYPDTYTDRFGVYN
ncbi:MAG: YCF48-related protein, partial [Bacteroidota bacterium]